MHHGTTTRLFREHRCHHIADSVRSLGRWKPNSIECSRELNRWISERLSEFLFPKKEIDCLPVSLLRSPFVSSFQFRVLRILFFSCSLTMNGCRYVPILFPVSNECRCEQLAKTPNSRERDFEERFYNVLQRYRIVKIKNWKMQAIGETQLARKFKADGSYTCQVTRYS